MKGNPMALRGKTALVTGGAVRIGRAIVEALAAEGCRVVIHCDRSVAAAERVRLAVQRAKGKAWVVREHLDGQAACERVMASAVAAAGRVDILINNAAVFHKDTLVSLTEARLHDEFMVNGFVPILLTRAFAARVRHGAVVNLLDRRIRANDVACLPYSLSKKALAAFTEEAALSLAPRITVNAVAPGAVLPPPGKGAAYLHDKAGRVPLGRRIMPGDIARAVVALLALRGVTGQILYVDGGQHLLGNGA
jgi:NAD(P)-dependent dehydrogenase (short-subunit alcohol dehydrogenase family)